MITPRPPGRRGDARSPLASKLKADGFHGASEQNEAGVLSDLHTQVVAARNAAVQAMRADSLRGVAGDGLEKSVKPFNAFANEGVDNDFDRGTCPWAATPKGSGRS